MGVQFVPTKKSVQVVQSLEQRVLDAPRVRKILFYFIKNDDERSRGLSSRGLITVEIAGWTQTRPATVNEQIRHLEDFGFIQKHERKQWQSYVLNWKAVYGAWADVLADCWNDLPGGATISSRELYSKKMLEMSQALFEDSDTNEALSRLLIKRAYLSDDIRVNSTLRADFVDCFIELFEARDGLPKRSKVLVEKLVSLSPLLEYPSTEEIIRQLKGTTRRAFISGISRKALLKKALEVEKREG